MPAVIIEHDPTFTATCVDAALDALALLPDGWADVDSIAPSAESIAAARVFARALLAAGCAFEVDGDVNGYVAVTMHAARGGRQAWFSVYDLSRGSLVMHGDPAAGNVTMRVAPGAPDDAIRAAREWVST